MRTTGVGALCSAKRRSSFREVTVGPWANSGLGDHTLVSEPLCWITGVLFGLSHTSNSVENIFYMAFSKQWSANQQESITEKWPENLTEVTPSLILPCIHTRKQTKWRSNKNNKHSVLGPGLLGCLVVHENHQIRIHKMGLEFSFKKKKRESF